MTDRARVGRGWALILVSLILLIIGGILATAGGYLAWLGGSPYYIIAGVATTVSGVLLLMGRRAAPRLYAMMLWGTVIWAIGEVGFDGWELAPRVLAPAVLGLAFLIPAIRNRLIPERRLSRAARLGFFTGAPASAILLGLFAHQVVDPRPADPIFQRGMAAAGVSAPTGPDVGTDWLNYGNDPGGSRFSPLAQINADNVDQLKPAWRFKVGADRNGEWSPLQATPLKVGSTLYVCTAYNDVIALDAETGRQRWRFRSGITVKMNPFGNCRGLAYFKVPDGKGDCPERIITNTVDARLIALDSRTGKLCASFGEKGQTSLLTGLGQPERGYYFVTSAPTLVRGKVVVGGWVTDGQFWGEPSGVVRAFDATTGRLAWAFDMGRPDRKGEPGPGQVYTPATPNSWAPMSADPELGLVYVPTGNATPDYFGGQRRPFDDKYSTSVVALDADTGAVRWSFQAVHHDVWDYDMGSQPTLVDIPFAGGVRRALVQASKPGEIFLLDRATGKPITRVEERPVPQRGAVPEERLSPTQPFSIGMPSLAGPLLTERSMWGLTPIDQLWCRIQFRSVRYDGAYTPPGLDRSVFSPGRAGATSWGSVSVDRDRHLLIVNALRLASETQLIGRAEADKMGLKPGPYSIHAGANSGGAPQAGTPYGAKIPELLSPLQVPCTAPPYGMISAIDLRTKKLVWTRRLGTAAGSGPLGIPTGLPIPMGTPTIGGSITTRGGLTFIAANPDGYFRAFETSTGRILWQARLPASGISTPMTYTVRPGSRQFVVITAAGSKNFPTGRGDYLVAYALPEGKGGQRDGAAMAR